MPQRIDVPGMGIVEFPDGMDDEAIAAAIKQNAAPSVADEVGAGEAVMIGAGREVDRLLKGAQQLWHGATGNDKALDALRAEQSSNDKAFAELQQRRPVATAVGGALPMMAVPMSGAGGALGLMGRAALSGGLMEGMKYGSLEERLTRGAVGAAGGAAGAGVGATVAKVLKPGAGGDALSTPALRAADRLGVKLTAGQKTQSPALINMENYLSRSPGSSGMMQSAQRAQQSAYNRAAARAMGETADDLGERTFSVARDRIGSEFDRLQGITSPQLSNDFLNTIAKLDTENAARGAFKNADIEKLVDKSLDLAVKGKLSGQAYKEIRSEISSSAERAFRAGDSTLGQAYKAVRKSLDDAAEQSLSAADKKAWAAAREQWKAYKTLTKSNVSEAGNVSPARVAAAVRREGDALRTGRATGELADLARIGEAVKGAQNPNSGQLAQQMLFSNPLTGVPLAVGNAALAATYTRPLVQRYLAGGVDVGATGRGLLGASGAGAGEVGLLSWLGAR